MRAGESGRSDVLRKQISQNKTNLLPLFLLIFFSLSSFAPHSTTETPGTGYLHGGDDGKNAPFLSASLQSPLILKASRRLLRRRVNTKSEKGNVVRWQGFIGYDSENAMCNNGLTPFLLYMTEQRVTRQYHPKKFFNLQIAKQTLVKTASFQEQ